MSIKRLDHVNFVTNHPQETIDFYCDLIGLRCDQSVSMNVSDYLYFFIPNEPIAILHIGNAKAKKEQPTFQRFADLDSNNHGEFSTGAVDHFCLVVDMKDYDGFIRRLEDKDLDYQTYSHQDGSAKQIWVLDPNGVRVELNFR